MQKREFADMAKGAIGACAVSIALLLWSLLGEPPYAFYGLLKWVVAASAGYGSYVLWTISKKFAPFCLLLIATGAYIFFGKMRRTEWIPFDWAAVVLFGVVAILLSGKRRA